MTAMAGRPLRALAIWLSLLLLALALQWPRLAARVAEVAAGLAPPVQMAAAAAPAPPAVAADQPATLPMPDAAAPPRRRGRAPAAMIAPASTGPAPLPAAVAPPAIVPHDPPASQRPVMPPAAPAITAFSLADQAYARLRDGQRRQAVALFDAALAMEPGNGQWRAERAALTRRWQLGGFALLRDGGPPPNQPGSGQPGVAASPVLGGGQIGGSIAFLPDPLARRPLAIVARAVVAADRQGVLAETGELAIGLRQTLLPGVTLSAERLLPLGNATQAAWTARLAAGGQWWRLSGYGEAGVLGNGQAYAGGQGAARLVRIGPAAVSAGTWASVQTGTPDVWRVDVGPSVSSQWRGLRLQADWRQRVAGNAAPGSGPAITVSAGF